MDPNAEDACRNETRRLALIERLDRHGHVQQRALVHQWPFRIGRSIDADMVLDDPHVAALHATLDVVDDGALHLTLGQTLNGAEVDGRALLGGQSASLSDVRTWRMGGSTFRIRLASDALSPELPLGRQGEAPVDEELALPVWRRVVPLLGLSVVMQMFERWLDNNPGTSAGAYLLVALGTVGATTAWALFWALGNKLFQGRLDFKVHLRFAVVYGLAWSVLEAGMPMLAYAMDWPLLSRLSEAAGVGVLCALIWSHLGWIMPLHRRGLMAGIASLYMMGVGLKAFVNQQRTGQYFGERYVTALPPPSWRLVGTQPVSVLIDEARGMKAGLDRLAKDGRNNVDDELDD